MFEFFEVPSQMIGAIGPVAQGTNFDWARQDTKPGLMNLNLIIDEEVFFSVFGSQNELQPAAPELRPVWSPPPFTGGAWVNPDALVRGLACAVGCDRDPRQRCAGLRLPDDSNVGVLAYDRLTNTFGIRMKASFAQFLSLRHGGSGFVFGYGSGATGQNTAVLTGNPNAPAAPHNPIPADRPFHSLSYPDINYTIMRPAPLPPSLYTDPADADARRPPRRVAADQLHGRFTSATLACATRRSTRDTPPTLARSRRGAPRPATRRPSFSCPRRFRSAGCSSPRTRFRSRANPVSNAGETGDPYINNLIPLLASVATGAPAAVLGLWNHHIQCDRQRRELVLGSQRDDAPHLQCR